MTAISMAAPVRVSINFARMPSMLMNSFNSFNPWLIDSLACGLPRLSCRGQCGHARIADLAFGCDKVAVPSCIRRHGCCSSRVILSRYDNRELVTGDG